MATRDCPSAVRLDDDGAVRVVAHPTTFEDFADGVYGQLRPYLAADPNAALHALRTIAEVGGRAVDDGQRAALRAQADALAEGAAHALGVAADRAAVQRVHREVVRVLSGQETVAQAAAREAGIGGTG